MPCPVCGSATADAGPTVHGPAPRVAGVPVTLGPHAARLRRCPGCDLRFKHPFVPDAVLLECYRRSPADNWEHDPDPRKRRFDEIAAIVAAESPGPRVLDVGCSNGALLAHLAHAAAPPPAGGGPWRPSGLEPSADAARVAAERDVAMLGATLEDLPPDARFDAVLAIDVLEHLVDPPTFVAAVARHLDPGGVFVALTGDPDAWGWRLQGAAYWYAALPEHQVFLARRTIERLAADHGLELVRRVRTSHARHSASRTVRDAVRGTLFGVARRLGALPRSPGPGWLPARDHHLVVLRRPR